MKWGTTEAEGTPGATMKWDTFSLPLKLKGLQQELPWSGTPSAYRWSWRYPNRSYHEVGHLQLTAEAEDTPTGAPMKWGTFSLPLKLKILQQELPRSGAPSAYRWSWRYSNRSSHEVRHLQLTAEAEDTSTGAPMKWGTFSLPLKL